MPWDRNGTNGIDNYDTVEIEFKLEVFGKQLLLELWEKLKKYPCNDKKSTTVAAINIKLFFRKIELANSFT